MTQEVFIKAFDQLPEADEESFGLRAWLYRVATNACFNQLRSRRKLDGGGDAGLEQATSGVDEFERAQTVALVEQSLGEMNERYRTALVLKDLQGLPPEEIAEVMEVSRPTADVLVHRARASFKTVFAKLAGADATAPAALGLVLVPLSVPATLQAMPPLPPTSRPCTRCPSPTSPRPLAPPAPGCWPRSAPPSRPRRRSRPPPRPSSSVAAWSRSMSRSMEALGPRRPRSQRLRQKPGTGRRRRPAAVMVVTAPAMESRRASTRARPPTTLRRRRSTPAITPAAGVIKPRRTMPATAPPRRRTTAPPAPAPPPIIRPARRRPTTVAARPSATMAAATDDASCGATVRNAALRCL